MDEAYKKALERVEILEKELAWIKGAIIAMAEGETIGEYMDFDQSAFLEENQVRRESYRTLTYMIDHLMEIKYCTYYSVRENLEKEFEEYREEVRINAGWGWKIEDPDMIAFLLNELQNIYTDGIGFYKSSAREHFDLQNMVDLLPEKCPWTLEELMENEIYELTGKLPKREKKHE